MNISSSVISAADTTVGGEEGLLGMAFHPGFATNGYFYLFYTGNAVTTASGRHDILSRFQVSAGNPKQGNTACEVRYIVQYDQADNHNAGDLHFRRKLLVIAELRSASKVAGLYGNAPAAFEKRALWKPHFIVDARLFEFQVHPFSQLEEEPTDSKVVRKIGFCLHPLKVGFRDPNFSAQLRQ